jgi:hypothetical protein
MRAMTRDEMPLLLLRMEWTGFAPGKLPRFILDATRDGATVADSIDVPLHEGHIALQAKPHMMPLYLDAIAAIVEHEKEKRGCT